MKVEMRTGVLVLANMRSIAQTFVLSHFISKLRKRKISTSVLVVLFRTDVLNVRVSLKLLTRDYRVLYHARAFIREK